MSDDLANDNLALLDDEQIRTYAEMAQAEIERMAHPEPCVFSCGCVRGLKAENERLRAVLEAEIERLRAVIRGVMDQGHSS